MSKVFFRLFVLNIYLVWIIKDAVVLKDMSDVIPDNVMVHFDVFLKYLLEMYWRLFCEGNFSMYFHMK